MQDFSDLLLRKFPNDSRHGFHVKPHLPAGRLGRLLNTYRKIRNPSDVLAFYYDSGFFSSDSVVFTGSTCYYEKGFFLLEDLKSVEVRKNHVHLTVNQGGELVQHSISTQGEEAARLLGSVFDDLVYAPRADQLVEETPSYEGYSPEAVNWLEIRDEVLRTIDLLHQRFNDGKLSLLEYEAKKQELLDRL